MQENTKIDWENLDLNYKGENKFSSFFSSQGNIHTYPAKAVPEMVKDLIVKINTINKIDCILDPFVGSGTTALEAKYLGIDFYGSDLNPLAVMLAKTKTLTIKDTSFSKKHLLDFVKMIKNKYDDSIIVPIENFKNINYWFKDKNIHELSYIKYEIKKFINNAKVYKECYALILLTAFSSTVRKVSLTRKGEFKLYRMSSNEIENHNINALDVFSNIISNLLEMLVEANINYKHDTKCEIYLQNAKNINYLQNEVINLVITSPPYGDSRSTVAYGQFSRLSIQWMRDLMQKYLHIPMDYEDCDELLLGGRKSDSSLKDLTRFYSSKELNILLSQIDKKIELKLRKSMTAKLLLINIMEKSEANLCIDDIKANDLLYKLICERLRLDIYRKIRNKHSDFKDKEIKKLAKKQSIECMKDFSDINNKRKFYRRRKLIVDSFRKVLVTLNRNYVSVADRKSEVISFFQDLYKVVLETDRVLKNNGFQVWIVGHRTILGDINVNMEGILKDWFLELGYCVIKSLSRKYSFKRMPHHINSTMERSEPVNTMMNEYILVVQKTNTSREF